MKLFVITTTSESSDHYVYIIRSKKRPTNKQLEKFLREHGNDAVHDEEDDDIYEYIQNVVEIEENIITEI